MEIDTKLIKELRDKTSAGVMDCKKALEETEGNVEQAASLLRSKGIASAAKKAERDTDQGVIATYIHSGGRIGSMVEVNCETDFVARTDDFSQLTHDIAMQIAAMAPKFVRSEDLPEGSEDKAEEVCLLSQSFIKDPSKSIQDLVNETVGKLGENIRVRRFERFSLGE